MGKLLKKVAESAVKQDKNGRNYKTVTFETNGIEIQKVGGRDVQVHVPVKSSSMNVYESSYLDNKEEFGYSLPLGSYVPGAIVTQNVEPYQIPDTRTGEMRTVSTYSAIVIGDTDDAEAFTILSERTIARRRNTVAVLAD